MTEREKAEVVLRDLLDKFARDWTAFNEQVIGFPVPLQPTMLTPERARFRGAFLQEEQNEFHLACGRNDLDAAVDALIDTIYVAVGTLGEMGVLTQPTWNEVQRANMKKRRGTLAKREGAGFDAVKPEGWKAPSHLDYLTITAEDVAKVLTLKEQDYWPVEVISSAKEQLTLKLDLDAIPALEKIRAMKPYSGEKPKLLIMGHGRHGKDSVCEILKERYGLKFTSSSWFCAERVMMPHFQALWGAPYASVEDCYNDRHNGDNRAIWYDAIRDFNRPDATALGRAIFAENDVYCGLRSKAEFHALKNTGAFDYAIWVDASDRVKAEDSSSITVEPWMADFVLDNNGTLADLEINLGQLMEGLL